MLDSLFNLLGSLVVAWWCYCAVSLFVFLCSSAEVRPIVKKYDGWIGFYHDNVHTRLYILPIPFVGFMVDFRRSGKGN